MKQNRIAAILALAWLAGITALYFVSHKPVTPALVLSLLGNLAQLAGAVALVTISGAVGWCLLKDLPGGRLPGFACQAAFGQGVVSLVVLLWGTVIGINAMWAWLALVILLAVLWRPALAWWRQVGELAAAWHPGGRLGRALAVSVALIMIWTLATALAPPLKFDALVYHLALPKIYLLDGNINYLPWNMYWGMPQAGEMGYTWAMALAGPQASACLGWMWGGIAILGLVGYVNERLGGRAAWVSAASLVTGFSLAASLAWAYIDWLAILYGLSLLAMLDAWRHEQRPRLLFWSGALAGMAFGVKYSAGILFVAGAVDILVSHMPRVKLVDLARSAGGYLLGAGMTAFPWLLKNFFATGNPFYPLFFPSGAMDQLRLDLYQGGAPWGSGWDAVILPLRATYLGLEAAPGYSATIGPLLLGLGALAWLGWREAPPLFKSTVVNAAWLAVAGLVAWALLGRFSSYLLQSRLYYGLFPAFAVLAGAGFCAMSRLHLPGVRLGRVAGVLILLAASLGVFDLGLHSLRQGALRVIFGVDPAEKYLENNLGWYAPAMQAVRSLPGEAQVLLLWEPRSFYCAPRCRPDEVLDRWARALEAGSSPPQILDQWQQEGFTHVLYYRLGADFIRQEDQRYRLEDWQKLDELLALLPGRTDFGEAYSLYALGR